LRFYSAFAIKVMWNWFAVPSLRAPSLSYWQVLGLLLILELMRNAPLVQDNRWDMALTVIDDCAPQPIKNSIERYIFNTRIDFYWQLFSGALSLIAVWTTILGLGWMIHLSQT